MLFQEYVFIVVLFFFLLSSHVAIADETAANGRDGVPPAGRQARRSGRHVQENARCHTGE